MAERPEGYEEPTLVYLVEETGSEEIVQLGGFFSRAEAGRLLAQLQAEGRQALRINLVPIHRRASDWEYDR